MFLSNLFKTNGILGINARNLLYIRPYNPKKAIKLADNKIKTKQYLSTRGVPVPKLYNIIRNPEELDKFDYHVLPNAFVLKPNTGFGGEGIIPIVENKHDYFITSSGRKYTKEEIKDHIRDILDGRFSISNIADTAFFEQHIFSDERIGKYSYEGLPDIRVVVHNLIPVMAMLRLPTKESEGRANLHQGAVGVGIDIAKGQATFMSYKNRIIKELPEGLGNIKGVKIPYWDDILYIASKVQLITNLGYMAADICIDKNVGPVLLEINARAGLGVQIANLAPLRKRLQRIEGVKVTNPTKGVRIAKDMFGNIAEKIAKPETPSKQIIGIMEEVDIIEKKGVFKLKAKIDTGRKITILDEETASKNGLIENPEDYDDEKSTLKLKFAIRNKRISTVVEIEKISNPEYKMIVGRRDLKDFLIDTSSELDKSTKNVLKEEELIKKQKISLTETDQKLAQIDNKIKLLYHLRPINLNSEKEKFFRKAFYNPQFEYPKLQFNPIELVDEINKIKTDDSPLGKLFEKKKEEILNKINLLETMGEDEFTEISTKLFSKPTEIDIVNCQKLLKNINLQKTEPRHLSSEKVKEEFEKTFEKYGLKNWKVILKENTVSNCVIGKNNKLFLKKTGSFSEEKIKDLIIHEIETHILTAENGKAQGYELFNRGLADYLKTQEGLAIYNVHTQTSVPFEDNYKIFSHVICIFYSIKNSFSETYSKLIKLGIPEDQAFRSCVKAKRGFYDTNRSGAFTKDYLYYSGYYEIKNFIEKGGDIKDLYIGKINLKELETIKKIPGLIRAKILPTWLK